MALIASMVLFVVLAVVIGIYGYRSYAKPGRLLKRFDESPVAQGVLDRTRAPKSSFLMQPLEALGRLTEVSNQDSKPARRMLLAAGYRGEKALVRLFGIKIILSLVLGILTIVFRTSLTANPILRIVMPVAGFGAGYWLPGFLLERKVRKRQERLRLSLPDALDLMVVSVEAGLGLDQAMLYVTRELRSTHPEI